MLRTLVTAAALTLLAAPAAQAALEVGAPAPDFTLDAALAGQSFRFQLAEALKQGPVVLYFFPAAFTTGCTIEANQFAEASDEFKRHGATVIGVSHDDIETMKRFSATECRNKFAVGADVDRRVMKAYDATMSFKPDQASRISYVISPQGRILYQYSSANPYRHVSNTLAAVKDWRERLK